MATHAGTTPCPQCGALVADGDGPTHAYYGASPGCWALYGEVPWAAWAPHHAQVREWAALARAASP